MVALRVKTTREPQPDLFLLPWSLPLAEWPDDRFVRLPRGRHRHVVRFLDHDGTFFALKELPRALADHEFRMLEYLREEHLPAVTLIGVAHNRRTAAGEPLESILVTRHLSYSLPYRSLFAAPSPEMTRHQLVDALAVLLLRLHLTGFYWGDCSLNNALFRRDGGSLRAYVVDTETSEVHLPLSDGMRFNDVDLASENVTGGLLDLAADGRLSAEIDPVAVGTGLVERYERLWEEVTGVEEVPKNELWRINARLARLNELGFDTEEFELLTEGAASVRFRPTVVDEGHHARRLAQVTGIEAHENQARRLLGAVFAYQAYLSTERNREVPEGVAAYLWLTDRWEPTLAAIPVDFRGRLEDAEIYCGILDHVAHLSAELGRDVDLGVATQAYVDTVLSRRRSERRLIDEPTTELPVVVASDDVPVVVSAPGPRMEGTETGR